MGSPGRPAHAASPSMGATRASPVARSPQPYAFPWRGPYQPYPLTRACRPPRRLPAAPTSRILSREHGQG